MAAMMRRGLFLLGLVLAGPPWGPAAAQTDPGYRIVPPPQQAPLPWQAAPTPRTTPVPAPQPPLPDLSANYERLRQSRQAQELEEMRNALFGNAVRPRD
ncbi:hypothetical protein [Falsiroseomonas oryziterrae]|uniref:hypothetical protein n=1 Tax=Falsiroseomonas oryziterrae TaxID=2911368 RepID=UPI001F395931|nr:hypothetical protein [Roseomonas sp. NPKOSM-4]